MPPHSHPQAHICSNCNGHASVAITLGGRDRHGHLRIITANCRACHGTGTSRRSTAGEGARA
ncbi:hypothetical protein J8N05_14165 [Streptomyces sp. BH-SS-21]|uniref:Uncharacterized protein n=1 Tax=Streptomyces liliiviolaceus TaxID=2823109 RepID=A0A940XSX6_9ACTN|nr:hypothetical protein [Streptomyces liliiviolaceus]MBQ0849350.1 hypothetical protein [Streptomyces liliiviolaceus]